MPSVFEWRDEYTLGVSAIDEQHRGLFRSADRLHQALLVGEGKAGVEELLAALLEYVRVHFADEERLMRSVGYPGYAAHHAEHRQLDAGVAAFQARREAGDILITIRLLTFLGQWLSGHVIGSDRAIADWMATESARR